MPMDSSKSNDQIERRKHERYSIQEDVIAMIGPAPAEIGWIVDISMGGFAFEYKGRKKRLKKTPDMALLLEENGTEYASAPIKCDVQIVSSSKSFQGKRSGVGAKKRCSMQFGELTYYQKVWLESLIQKQSEQESEERQSL